MKIPMIENMDGSNEKKEIGNYSGWYELDV